MGGRGEWEEAGEDRFSVSLTCISAGHSSPNSLLPKGLETGAFRAHPVMFSLSPVQRHMPPAPGVQGPIISRGGSF